MNYKRKLLSNGIRVIVAPMPSLESATALVMVGAGSRYENKLNNGISHFLEHMAFKGTQKRPTALDIMTEIDGIGGEFNAFTSKEVTGYYIKSSKNHIETCLEMISDILQHSKFDAEEIEKERGVILQEISMYEDTPMRKIGDVYENLVFGNTALGWDVLGESEIIKNVKRQDFTDYMAKLYSADNITVVLAGGITEDQAFTLAEKYFGEMAKFEIIKYLKVDVKQDKPRVLLKTKKTEQVHLAIGFRTVDNYSPDRYILAVLATILGGGASSRLFHEVREKRGLAYFVRAHSEQYQDNGMLTAFAGVDPVKVEEAIKVILEQFKIAREGNLGGVNELKKAKEYLKGHMVLELEDSRSVAGFFAQQELLDEKIETIGEIIEQINSVTKDELREVARKYFTADRLNLAIIGDFSDKSHFEELLII
jgi:predicted Zn-dependent peptidase